MKNYHYLQRLEDSIRLVLRERPREILALNLVNREANISLSLNVIILLQWGVKVWREGVGQRRGRRHGEAGGGRPRRRRAGRKLETREGNYGRAEVGYWRWLDKGRKKKENGS